MSGSRAKRIPVPLGEMEYKAIKAIGEKEERPMACIITKAVEEWLVNHCSEYPEILGGTQQDLFGSQMGD